jgi:hypothetical protein
MTALVLPLVAAAGNPHGTPPGQQKQQDGTGASAQAGVHAQGQVGAKANGHANGQATVHGNARATVHGSTNATAHGNGHATVHGNGHAAVNTTVKAHGRSSTSVGVQAGVKSSASSSHWTTAAASSSQTKLYGNGQTAGQIATQAGYGSSTLVGPGNSQAHKVLCGLRMIDVHALKAKGGRCAAAAGQAGGSATMQAKLYGNGSNAAQIAVLLGLQNVVLYATGNSGLHKVACGAHMVDVHALKAHLSACLAAQAGAGATLGASAGTNGTAGVQGQTGVQGQAGTQTQTSNGQNVSAATQTRGATTVSSGRPGGSQGGVLGATATNRPNTGSSSGSGILGGTLGSVSSSSTLPFTGLALWIPAALALLLLAGGFGLRRAAARPH